MKHLFHIGMVLFILYPLTGTGQEDTVRSSLKERKFAGVNVATKRGAPLDSQQTKVADVTVLNIIVVDGDTLPLFTLPEYAVEERVFTSDMERKRYHRLEHNVKKVYPYAKLAGEKKKEYEEELIKFNKKRDRKRYIKSVEEALKEEYGDELKQMTITQGKILIRLIDRETGENSYELVKEMRGVFSAFFWQSLARLFGHNLKTEYDPENYKEDRLIEEIIQKIENEEI